MRSTATALMIAATVAACGGDDGPSASDFFGVYATTSHTYARDDGPGLLCADAAPAFPDAKPYFKLAKDDFFDDPNLAELTECDDAAGTVCTDTLVSAGPGGPGLEQVWPTAQRGGGFDCQLHYVRYRMVLDGTVVHVEALDKYDAPDVSSDDCTLELAEGLADSPDCETVERWDGTLVE